MSGCEPACVAEDKHRDRLPTGSWLRKEECSLASTPPRGVLEAEVKGAIDVNSASHTLLNSPLSLKTPEMYVKPDWHLRHTSISTSRTPQFETSAAWHLDHDDMAPDLDRK
jgi:hypothetical protein